MNTFEYQGKKYSVGFEGFLTEYDDWDENLAKGMAPKEKIDGGLTEAHWRVIRYIRDTLKNKGICPLVYETCRSNGLHISGLKRLFPTGYHRGACKLAGITYAQSYLPYSILANAQKLAPAEEMKTYRIDTHGFLVDSQEWDERFSLCKAHEMKMGELTQGHWRIINFIRDRYKKTGVVPTVYETCEGNSLDIKDLRDLEKLFPDGYQRGAIKIAGLRMKQESS